MEIKDFVMEETDESSFDSMVCEPSSRLIHAGFMRSDSTVCVLFVNAGGKALSAIDAGALVQADNFCEGGTVVSTGEAIMGGGDYPFLYQSARLGMSSYRFSDLPPGNYIVDLHFVEIINTNGPKGKRVFNVYIQEKKVLSEFDIFAVVGANKPLQLIDSRVSVNEDGTILITFESVSGSPVVSGICIRRDMKISAPQLMDNHIQGEYCDGQNEIPQSQRKVIENEIEEFTTLSAEVT